MLAEIVGGIIAGAICGLIPGLHPNILAIFFKNPFTLISASASHVPFDIVVSFLVLGGDSKKFKLAILGVLVTTLIFPIFIFCVPSVKVIYSWLSWKSLLLLLALVSLNILSDKPIKSLLIFLSAGLLGKVIFSLPMSSNFKIFSLLSGLFAIPALILPEPTSREIPQRLCARDVLIGTLVGLFSGALVGLLPATSQSLASFALWLPFSASSNSVAISSGATVTSALLFSIATLAELGKARNGALIGIDLPFETMMWLSVVALSVSTAFSILFQAQILKMRLILQKSFIRYFAVIFVLGIVTYLSGFLGLIVALTSTALGIITYYAGVRRNHLTGALLIPVFSHFVSYLF